MEKLSGVLGPEHMVTDVGSTKGQIAEAAWAWPLQHGWNGQHFCPAIPSRRARSEAAQSWPKPALFRGTVCLFTRRLPRASVPVLPMGPSLVKGWREWVTAMGAKTLDLDPARHDELVAWVSHLPQFVATALSAVLEEEVGEAPELKDVGGRGLREMTRLGASPYSMWRDIAYTNTEAIDHALQILEQRLAHLRETFCTPELRDEFEQANKFRRDQ